MGRLVRGLVGERGSGGGVDVQGWCVGIVMCKRGCATVVAWVWLRVGVSAL